MVAPLVGAAVIGGVAQGLGGLLNSGNKMSKQQLAEMKREYDISQRFNEEQGRSQTQMSQTGDINSLNRQMEMAPIRDKISYMMNQRMGMVPQSFQPRDMMNPQSAGSQNPQQGGIDAGALQGAMSHYQAPDFQRNTMGSGGIDPRMYTQLMSRLGLSNGVIGNMPVQQGAWGQGPPPPQPIPQNIPNQGQVLPNGMGGGGGPPPPQWGGGMPGQQMQPQPLKPSVNIQRRY